MSTQRVRLSRRMLRLIHWYATGERPILTPLERVLANNVSRPLSSGRDAAVSYRRAPNQQPRA